MERMNQVVRSTHGNKENVVTTGVHLIIKRHINKGYWRKTFKIMRHYKKLHPSRVKEIDETFTEHFERIPTMIWAICHDLGIREPNLSRNYAYVAHSYRNNGKIRKITRYVGPMHEKLSMKDLVWLMIGQTKFKDVEEWHENSQYSKWLPLCKVRGLNLRYAILYLIKKVGFAPCACDYIIQHGYPVTFKELFDKYELTETLTKEAIRHAQTRLKGTWQEPTKYYSGTMEEAERNKQFLLEHNEMPTCKIRAMSEKPRERLAST